MKMPATYQSLVLFGWFFFAISSYCVYHSARTPAPIRLAVYVALASVTACILGLWWHTAYSASGDLKFANEQLRATILKVGAQTALLGIALYVIFALARGLGEKALPHLLGIEFKPQGVTVQSVLPFAVWFGSLVMAGLLLALLGLALAAYGLVSPMDMGAIAGLLVIGGAWGFYWKLTGELREEAAQAAAGAEHPKADVPAGNTGPDRNRNRKLMEYRLGTREWNALVFHRIADEPYGLAFRFPGYLIGVEQANRYLIDVPPGDNRSAKGRKIKGIASLLNDRRRTFVSHIVEFSGYGLETPPKTQDPVSAVSSDSAATGSVPSQAVKTDLHYNIYDSSDHRDAYRRGFAALNGLKENLEEKISSANGDPDSEPPKDSIPKTGAYTHILVFCMGWNTDQQESVRNYNSLMGFLTEAARKGAGKEGLTDEERKEAIENEAKGAAFNPLVIGLSWPSEWSFLKPLSYLSKAGDADETGLVWGSYLLKKVLIPLKLKHRLPLVMVGHSFGVRVLSRAVASNPDWVEDVGGAAYVDRSRDTVEIDLFMGLQGAVSANRFVSTGPLISGWFERAPYSHLTEMKTRFILTWAEKDNANPIAAYVTGAHHVGGKFGNEFCLQRPEVFWPVVYRVKAESRDSASWLYREKGQRYDPETGWDAAAITQAKRIFTMDVSEIVQYQPYGKGGGAHSDIYTPEMGKLLWNSILAFAPAKP